MVRASAYDGDVENALRVVHWSFSLRTSVRNAMKVSLPLLGLVLVVVGIAQAGVFYDEQAQCIQVADFPKEFPCTLERLLAMDRLYGWGKITHGADTDTYTIAGDLHIGTNDGTDTYFQIGSQHHPRETLVMKGRLVVCPFWIQDENRETAYWKGRQSVNRLTIGVSGDASVKAALKFHGGKEAGHTLYLGRVPVPDGKTKVGHGGQLFVHHGTITSTDQQPGFEFGVKDSNLGMCLTGDRIVLDHAALSWISGFMTYGMGYNAKVSDTVFEHGGAAVINGQHDLKRCTFRHCGTAIKDYGCLDAVLTDCVFEDNDCNYELAYTNKGLICIDCTYDTPKKGNVYRSWTNRETKKKQYPSFVSKRHVVVEAVDEKGKAVPGARVRVTCEQGTFAMAENRIQVTNEAGRTPGKGESKPILLTEVSYKATDEVNHPDVTEYTYSIEVKADGFAAALRKGLRPTKSWETIRIALEKQ